MKIKSYFVAFFAIMAIGLMNVSCGDDYDDSAINEKLESIENRVSKLESWVAQANSDIINIKKLIENSNNGITIVKYAETASGYRITFSDGTFIDIKNGKDGADGKDGQNGKDGADGKDGQNGKDGEDGKDAGNVPVIGIAMENGVYYWTITVNGQKTFLLGENGEKLPVIGKDGEDGTDGKDGQDGINGVTPIIKIDSSGFWIISYNGGTSFSYILDTNGKPVSALGSSGNSGENSPSYITDIVDKGEYYLFKLYDGSSISVYKYVEFRIEFYGDEVITLNEDGTYMLYYKIIGVDDMTSLETLDKGNIVSTVIPMNNIEGHIKITATDVITSETKLIVLLYNGTKTVTTVFKIESKEDSRLNDVVPEDIQDEIDDWMPIYKGTNPPIIEGTYFIDPYACVYCEDYGSGGYASGEIISSYIIRFYNQNIANNTISMDEASVSGRDTKTGTGAFISGEGNYFTAYFNTVGQSSGISTKTAVVISGEKSEEGIKNLKYAFVMVDKGDDPDHLLMEEGIFRVFEDADGISYPTTWNNSKPRGVEVIDELSKFTICSNILK